MKNIKILDCTLRDGGYVNDWNFGRDNIKEIIRKLNEANIDIIECGFLRDDIKQFDINKTNYDSFDNLINLGDDLFEKDRTYTLMMLAESYDISNLVDKNQSYIDTIRLSFHKRDIKKAIKMSKIIKEKGYNLYLQPTATMRYTDLEIKELIKVCNEEIKPNSVAIVDTFGEMLDDNIIHFTKLFDKYLNNDITLAFHSHNNLQTSYSNVILFINNIKKDREVVVDSSIFGMGRGAGNLCSELIINYLNEKFSKDYKLFPLLEVIDNILSDIRKKYYWGYSLEYYLSAINHCHPNYCIYFSNKKTLTTYDLGRMMELISEDKKVDFDKEYAESLYYSYNNSNIDDDENYQYLKKMIGEREIVLLGPGNSLLTDKEKIQPFVINKSNYFTIAINNNLNFDVDAYFFSNRKRYNTSDIENDKYCLLTSNIDVLEINNDKNLIFDYQHLLALENKTSDNALLLILNLLKKIKYNKVYLAGFDGFEYEQSKNFYDDKLVFLVDKNRIDELNNTLTEYIDLYKNDIEIRFITNSIYENRSEK